MMKTKLIFVPPTPIAYVRAVGPYAEMAPRAWDSLRSWLRTNGLFRKRKPIYGILHDTPEEVPIMERRYDAAISIEGLRLILKNTHEITIGQLEGGAYAQYSHTGCYSLLPGIHKKIKRHYDKQMAISLDLARPRLLIFHNDPDEVPANKLRTDFYFPLAPQASSTVGV